MRTDGSEGSTSLTCSPAESVLVQTDARGRFRVSKEQRKAVLAKFEQSGMSAAKFAAATGIKYSTLAGWLQRYRRPKPRVAAKGVHWVEAVIGGQPGKESGSETGVILHLPGSVQLQLSSVAQIPLAVALLESLQNRGAKC